MIETVASTLEFKDGASRQRGLINFFCQPHHWRESLFVYVKHRIWKPSQTIVLATIEGFLIQLTQQKTRGKQPVDSFFAALFIILFSHSELFLARSPLLINPIIDSAAMPRSPHRLPIFLSSHNSLSIFTFCCVFDPSFLFKLLTRFASIALNNSVFSVFSCFDFFVERGRFVKPNPI